MPWRQISVLVPSGDKEEERHKEEVQLTSKQKGDAAGPAGQGGTDPAAAGGGGYCPSAPPHLLSGWALLTSGLTLLTAGW